MITGSSKAAGKKRAADSAMRDSAKGGEDSSDDEEWEEDDSEEEEIYDEGEEGEEGEEGMDMEGVVRDGCQPSELEGKLYRAGDALAEGETLDFDPSAYTMLHRMNTEWPCLTFDVVQDGLGQQRTKYPLTAFTVAGTQAESADQNKIMCMKLSDLTRTQQDEDDEDDDESDDDGDEPTVDHAEVPHPGTVNRLRLMPGASHICATWADTGHVHMWDLSVQLASLSRKGDGPPASAAGAQRPVHTFAGHADEGYALGFSSVVQGRLASGDCASKIHMWQAAPGGSWAVDPTPFEGHTASVEDLCWSPSEAGVMMSCGCDSTVRVWDVRKKAGSALAVDEGHGTDVNVMSWNHLVNYLVATGADDGSFRIWDLRKLADSTPVALFRWHTKAITSIEWSPHESSTVALTGADDQLTLWDLALEADPEADAAAQTREDLKDIPPQLYFVHQGQRDMKELHWHPQLPGVLSSTAGSSMAPGAHGGSYHIFKPANHGDGPSAQ